jgi:hypothetical protein
MIFLLERLSDLRIRPYFAAPRTKAEELANWETALRFLRLHGVEIAGCIAEDLYYGSPQTTLSLLAVVAKHFSETPPMAKALRKSVLLRKYRELKGERRTSGSGDCRSRDSSSSMEAIRKKEVELAEKEQFLGQWERELR